MKKRKVEYEMETIIKNEKKNPRAEGYNGRTEKFKREIQQKT